MEAKDIVAVTGEAGLFTVKTNGTKGVFVESLSDQRVKFIPAMDPRVLPLEHFTVITNEDSVELYDVFHSMAEKETETPVVEPNSANDALRTYFSAVLPDYDEARVYISDIKKIVKWYAILKEKKLLPKKEKKKDE
ncbi:MAG: DUF5606 domain-containing protein [Bacteroidetes bacterium]|nr:DUF5606 domain-containing protein [Bacteroidota bacterium]